jgi:pectate lyase
VANIKCNCPTGIGTFGKPGIIDSPDAVGGWSSYRSSAPLTDSDHDGIPDAWEKKHGLNPYNYADRNKVDKEGYTMLEAYLNTLIKK